MIRSICILMLFLALGAATHADRAENVVLITYDGFRWQEVFGGVDPRIVAAEAKIVKNPLTIATRYWSDKPELRREKLLPFLWTEIKTHGRIYGDATVGSPAKVTNGHNFSYPGYNEILTGAPDPRVDSNDKKNNPNVNVLEWLNRQPPFAGKVAAFTSWDVFPYILNTDRSGLPVNAGWRPLTEGTSTERLDWLNSVAADTPHYWEGVRFDVFTYNGAVEYVEKNHPRVLYISFGETDDWAHGGNYEQYVYSAARTDEFIKRLWTLLQSMPQYKDKTTLLLTTDHGRGDSKKDWTDHGEDTAGSDRIWLAALGAGVTPKGIVKNTPLTQSQVAATVAASLGEDFSKEKPGIGKSLDLAD